MHDPSTHSEVTDFWIEEGTPQPTVMVLAVHGDADLHSAPELRERIGRAIDRGANTVVVDLSATTLIDSTSLGVLLGGSKRLRGYGQLRLVVPRAEVRRVFEITMLDHVLPLHDTREEALAELCDQGT